MAWKGIITNAGIALLAARTETSSLTISRASAGAGRVDEVLLMAQTALHDERQTMSILSKTLTDKGARLRLQITAPASGYAMGQYGVWAKLDGGGETLLALYQSDTDLNVPSKSDSPDFAATFFALLTISNLGTLELTVDPSALVTRQAMEEYFDAETANLVDVQSLTQALKSKADLQGGKVPDAQLPAMDFIPTREKGAVSGVASLDKDGKVPTAQLPAMNYDPAGSAAAVQTQLTAHTGNAQNPHNVTAAQVHARPDTWTPTATQVGADPAGAAAAVQKNLDTHTKTVSGNPHKVTAAEAGAVPTGRKVNNKPLSTNITLSASDVGARPSTWVPTWNDIKDLLPLSKGGTGAADAAKALYALITGATALASDGVAADDVIGLGDVSGATGKKITLQTLFESMGSLLGAARIQTGSYVGTGTYGQSNPCKITFDFVPKIVFFCDTEGITSATPYTWGAGAFNTLYSDRTHQQPVSLTEPSTIAWHCEGGGADFQLNQKDHTYLWFAIL